MNKRQRKKWLMKIAVVTINIDRGRVVFTENYGIWRIGR